MVKKFIYSLLALIAFTSVANVSAQEVQEKKNEMQFGIGVGGVCVEDANFGKFYNNVKKNQEDVMPYAHFTAQYMHNYNKNLGLGVEAAVGAGSTTLEQDKKDIGKIGHVDVSAMLVGRCYWIHKEHFGLYSKIGIGAEGYFNGVSLEKDYKKDNKVNDKDLDGDSGIRFTANVAPIGVDFGGSRVKAFVETGIGRQATLNAGVKFNF